MKNQTRVLVTGHNGYIGSILTPLLMRSGYDVVGTDTGFFEQCSLVPDSLVPPAIVKDIRDLTIEDLRGFEAIVHLAALSNDPIGNLNSDWTEKINFRATVRLAEIAREAGVHRFVLSSSCIMYGMSEAAIANEESALDPKTEYARSKVKCEMAISHLASDDFSPSYLRNGTVYGLSPRMRFDTVMNELVSSAMTTGQIVIFSDGKPWRPVVHVRDVARAFLAVLEAPRQDIHNQAFNTGAEHLNCQIGTLGEIVARTVQKCDLRILSQPGADQRTYRTDFSKFARTFPHFEFRFAPENGARQLYDAFSTLPLTPQLATDRRFTRLKWLKHLLETSRLDSDLRWIRRAADMTSIEVDCPENGKACLA